MKVFLFSLSILFVAGFLVGCENIQQVQNKNQVQKQNNQQVQVTQEAGNQNRNNFTNRGRKFMKSNYVVDASDNVQSYTLLNSVQKGDLTEEEKNGLIQMREEEKLAHDVYVTMYQKWGLNIFNNISRSEQTHTDTVKYLLERYNIEDPVKDMTIGVFTDPKMTELYKTLTTKGEKSLIDALQVGAAIEDLDIKDLEDLLLKTDNDDIKIAYQNLNKGSRNHLRAFIKNLERNSSSYTPQYISQERFNEIINGEQEKGSVDANGNSMGMKQQGRGGRHGLSKRGTYYR